MLHLQLQKITGNLPTSVFDLKNDSKNVGFLQIRHKVSSAPDIPKEFASHIYYEIDENERGKGYGNEILKLALIEAKKIGLNKVILTCDENNLASKKIIENNGGKQVLHSQLKNGLVLLKYEIDL